MRREKSYVLNETTKLSPWDEYSVEEAGFQLKHKRALLWRQTKGTLFSKSIKIAKKNPENFLRDLYLLLLFLLKNMVGLRSVLSQK